MKFSLLPDGNPSVFSENGLRLKCSEIDYSPSQNPSPDFKKRTASVAKALLVMAEVSRHNSENPDRESGGFVAFGNANND